MRPEVADREEHGEGLLHADEAVKGPFTVELDNGEVGGDARAGDDVLAGVVAFGGAVPEEEAAGQGWQILVSGWFARSCLFLFVFGGARESYGWGWQSCRERSFRLGRSGTRTICQ